MSGRPGMRFSPRQCAGCPASFTPASGFQRYCTRDCWCRHRGVGPPLASQVRVCGRCQARYTPAAAGQRYCGECTSCPSEPVQHQIRLMFLQGQYGGGRGEQAVTCTCLAVSHSNGGRPGHEVIEARRVFPAAEAIAAWRDWHAGRGDEMP